ncbi:TPA: DUF4238 domain-containing protein [Xanthomonas vasicola pv. zeae]|uniref:DUF4238 domain-containing protein n=4 Tax=Xanthomonas vasicola TaxID=56459 RepID=A0AAE8F8I4_XANVA|nr:DUF4238 domain-containing protein [Xanthomonas vasicola]AVQ08435.1 DUF4238 domain-containing protein [Xanthomonas vasicola pv. vasculorum]AZM72631.1 DUF4238 domain-containing protein [Xanthomonas vasicola pv. vasculorum]MBV6748613.1 DUF4238 domain-containing protein [Xanthomonas vasicola pv. vasculorum NCPPB 890]MBV6894281.1 DUF4238 domain-containing protein [Xanthomonas vasicola pv. vasculorum]MDO6950166.1 DUF4238 domain-containing protein [Xanthomonas vasicola]
MPQLYKDNHYVPQLYLKRWSVDERILTYSLLVAHHNVPLWKPHSPKWIAFHQHLYTGIVDGQESDELERWLCREFEDPAQEPLSRATGDDRLDPDDWHKLVRFAFAQDVRTPAYLRKFIQRQKESLPALLDSAVQKSAEKLMNGEIPKNEEEKIENNRIPLKVSVEASDDDESGVLRAETLIGRSLWHWAIRQALTNTIAKVPNNGWTIRKPAQGYTWPTSDNPLIKLSYRDELNYNFGGGWDVPRGDVFLPLSPTHLLHRCGGVRPPIRGDRLDVATTEKIIRIIVEHADRYVFAHQEFNVESIRKRIVDGRLVKEEQAAWKNWHLDQAQAEQGY